MLGEGARRARPLLGEEPLAFPVPKEATVVFAGFGAATQDQAWSRGPEQPPALL